jgi:hypothetical protein
LKDQNVSQTKSFPFFTSLFFTLRVQKKTLFCSGPWFLLDFFIIPLTAMAALPGFVRVMELHPRRFPAENKGRGALFALEFLLLPPDCGACLRTNRGFGF